MAAAGEDGRPGYGYFSVQLTGREVPGGGDSDGQGYVRLDLDPEHETACFVTKWRRVNGAVTAFRLHAGHRGSVGPRRIDFFNGKHFDGRQNTVTGCVHVDGSPGMSSREKIEAVIRNPSGFYLSLHSTEFEDGAIRGQLG
ncbi:MAG: CHRD domain-containing protein [Pseudonocardiaceae bacterium]